MSQDFCWWLLSNCPCHDDSSSSVVKQDEEATGMAASASLTIEESLKNDRGTGNGSDYKIKQLFNRHGYNLAISAGHVRGIREAFDPRAVLKLIPVGVGEVKIQGLESGLYLAMNPKGKLYAETEEAAEATVFLETSTGYFLHYLSKKYAHMGWYVGITKHGRAKNAEKTWYPWGQKAIQFVSRRPYDEPHPLRQMRNLHGQTLAILPDGKVKGVATEDPSNPFAILEFTPTEPPGAFRIRGIEANLYLAMDAKGRLYGETDRQNGATVFAEHADGQYYVYLSAKFAHHGWHVGLTKAGKAKRGHRTAFGQKAIRFSRKAIVPSVLSKNPVLLQQDHHADLSFIDEDDEDGEVLRKGPTQVRQIKEFYTWQ